jgi:hypothetical protein
MYIAGACRQHVCHGLTCLGRTDMLCCSPAQVLAVQSGKMGLLDRLLKQLQPRGHKVLIFSQVRTCCRCFQSLPAIVTRICKPCALKGIASSVIRWH